MSLKRNIESRKTLERRLVVSVPAYKVGDIVHFNGTTYGVVASDDGKAVIGKAADGSDIVVETLKFKRV